MESIVTRILVIDANPEIHADFRKIFIPASFYKNSITPNEITEQTSNSFAVDSAFAAGDGISLVKRALSNNQPYTLAIMDLQITPDLKALEALKKIWELDPYIQTILCTDFSEKLFAETSNNLGITDRLLILKKPFAEFEVQQSAQALMRKYQLTKDIKQQINVLHKIVNERTKELEVSLEQLEHHATHDNLTKLPNRTLFYDRLKQTILKSKNTHLPFSILFIDVNRFKEINDTLGHSLGDILLQEIANRLRKVVSDYDTIARIGGDEFAMLLTSTHTEQAIIPLIHKIVEMLASPFQIKEHQLLISPSIGISVYPKDGIDAETLTKHADIAMYKAKSLPHKYFQFYSDEINKHAVEQLEIENDLLKAIQQKQFVLHYQPIVNLITGKIIGMEALLRWQHPKLGLLAPNKFISIAEETGLIIAIGEWVLEAACLQVKKWHDSNFLINIAVNCSVLQLEEADILSLVSRVLEKTKLKPHYLELELTENIIIKDNKEMFHKLKNLKKMGIQLVIDDFGIGYSSLSYLGAFPIDKIKIDKVFVDNIDAKKQHIEILLAIIAIGRALNLTVLAEGVETQQQLDFLIKHNCNEAQGEVFSKPLSLNDATNFLHSKQRGNLLS